MDDRGVQLEDERIRRRLQGLTIAQALLPLMPAGTQLSDMKVEHVSGNVYQVTIIATDETAAANLVSAVNGATFVNNLSTALGLAVGLQSAPVVTTRIVAGPSPPPPSPPPTPPVCYGLCERLLDGADLASRDYQFMCVKREAGVNVCRPMWGSECPGRRPSCLMGHVANENALPGVCMDTSGKWQRRKCVRKKTKGKCFKKRVQKHCKATCGWC